MSISDELMWRYYEVLLHKTKKEVEHMKAAVEQERAHPMELKKEMAHAIIARFWSLEEANEAQMVFEELFQKKDYSHAQPVNCAALFDKPVWIVDILRHVGAVQSTSDARRLIEAGAVSFDDTKMMDFKAEITLIPDTIIRVGKHRFYKVV